MPSPISSRSQDLQETNLRLTTCLDRVVMKQGDQQVVTQEEISLLLSELMRTGAEFRAEPIPSTGRDPDFDRELEQYRRQVERLLALLPSIHGQLLTERARLEAQQRRIVSAAQWAQASRQTL